MRGDINLFLSPLRGEYDIETSRDSGGSPTITNCLHHQDTFFTMSRDKLLLYSYFRSSCSWRVRIALALKSVDYEYAAVHLVKGDQRKREYLETVNPLGQVGKIMKERERKSNFQENCTFNNVLEQKKLHVGPCAGYRGRLHPHSVPGHH